MGSPVRLLPSLLVVAVLLIAACSGDDSEAETETAANGTSAPAASLGQASGAATTGSGAATAVPPDSRRTLEVDCGGDLRAFRFDGRLSVEAPQSSSDSTDFSGIFASLLQDVKFSGAFVAPDRSQLKLDGGKDSALGTIEFVQIGSTIYTRFGSSGWQESMIGGPMDFLEQIDPREICVQVEEHLRADVPSAKERVNGVDAIRYDYDRDTLERIGNGVLPDVIGRDDYLPEHLELSVWVSEKEKFPVKMLVNASGQADGQSYAVEMELNVTDLNGNVTIDAPR